MGHFTLTREFYIPKNSTLVSDENSDAVAYIYTTAKDRPAAAIFFGKQAKPVSHYIYQSEARRDAAIAEAFANRKAHNDYVTERKAARKTAPVVSDHGYIDTPHAAILVRAALKQTFPGVKFSVISEQYSMGSHLTITWTDGPTKRQVDDLVGPYSGSRFDGMIDMSYSVDSWLLPDGSVVYGGTQGTQGSMGVVAADEIEKPHPEAKKVRFLGSRPHTNRCLSKEFQEQCEANWAALSANDRCDLWNHGGLPHWEHVSDGRRLAEITAA